MGGIEKAVAGAASILWRFSLIVWTAVFTAMDLTSVGGNINWSIFAYLGLGIIVLLQFRENQGLRSGAAKEGRAGAVIQTLTDLLTERASSDGHLGNRRIILVGGEETPREREAWANRKEYSKILRAWDEKVGRELKKDAPEFLAEWDEADTGDRPDVLREIIKELRPRL